MSIRGRVSVELAVLALGTLLFLTVLPRRPVVLDVALALFALGLVATTARDTRERVWGSPAAPFGERARHSTRRVLIATAVVLPLFGAWRVISGGQLITPTFALALIVFVPWAYLQQALFQFYLLGRVRTLLAGTPPGAVAVANGLLFGLVHLPHWDVAAVTVVAGTVWSWYYLRDRYLTPIALSHAVLGTTYFYWVRGEDLVRRWIGAG